MTTSSSKDNFNHLLQRALIEDYTNYVSSLPDTTELENYHTFSSEFTQSMNHIFQKRRHRKRTRQNIAWVALFGVIIIKVVTT